MNGHEDGRRNKIMSYICRVKAAIVLLLCLGLWSSYRAFRGALWELQRGGPGRDEMTLFGIRLEGIQRDLPRYGEAGYVADHPIDFGNEDFVRELVWARYWLAPVLVLPYRHDHLVIGNFYKLVPYRHGDVVIGNFHKPVPTKLLSEWHLVLLKDYGNGMMLFVSAER
jgi:hypothetical protein